MAAAVGLVGTGDLFLYLPACIAALVLAALFAALDRIVAHLAGIRQALTGAADPAVGEAEAAAPAAPIRSIEELGADIERLKARA